MDPNRKRNLPFWMVSDSGSDKNVKRGSDHVKGKTRRSSDDDEVPSCSSKGSDATEHALSKRKAASRMEPTSFNQLMEGVTFVLSGFVNPERADLRSQALEMGGRYQPDWDSQCTLLICAFANTPKFRQVAADSGTIVSKDWIFECHNQKKLVEIEPYLMHAGKPWRMIKKLKDQGNSSCKVSGSGPRRSPQTKSTPSKASVNEAPSPLKKRFSPLKAKELAGSDLNSTISWLQNQEEKPDPADMKRVAAEGIMTCLQDFIDAIKENKDPHRVMNDWSFVPLVVKELLKLKGKGSGGSLTKEELLQEAISCKNVYQEHFRTINVDDSNINQGDEEEDDDKTEIMTDDGFDSDATVEMDEEELNAAQERIAAAMLKG